MSEPEPHVIASLKLAHEHRELARVVMLDGDKEHIFLMTSPVRDEWKKYRREMTEAGGDIEKVEAAIERAALAQIRWPEREEVKALIERKPGIVQNFAEHLSALAGSQVETSLKKL